MLETLVLMMCVPTLQGDPPKTEVPEAAITEAGENPIAAAVRHSLESHDVRTDKPFSLVVSFQTSDPDRLKEVFVTPLAETKNEEGNIQYHMFQDVDEPEKFLLVERWKSLEALELHLAQPYLVQLVEDLDGLATIELRVLTPVGARGGKKNKGMKKKKKKKKDDESSDE